MYLLKQMNDVCDPPPTRTMSVFDIFFAPASSVCIGMLSNFGFSMSRL